MASPQHNAPSEPAKIEQIITEFFAKSLHIILEARSPCASSRNYCSSDPSTSSPSSSSSMSSIRPRDKWFNLALRECPTALENLEWWRQSNLELLVVDVILAQRPLDPEEPRPSPGGCLLRNLSAKEYYPDCWSSGQDEFVPAGNTKKIVERWIVRYESRKSGVVRDSNTRGKRSSGRSSHSSEMLAAYRKTYKKSIVLLRSLYATVRLLPSYKVFRELNSSAQIRPFTLTHRISPFTEPFTRSEDAEMSHFTFVPVETPCGRLCLSVSYLPMLDDVCSQPSTPLSTKFITDYVGSPLVDPLKRIQYLPASGPTPTYGPFTRRHSWSYDTGAPPSVSPSPSPTYSESRALQNPHTLPLYTPLNSTTPPHPFSRNMSLPHTRATSSDENWPSPPLSPSSSPSPPAHFPSRNPSNDLFRTESSPVRIPLAGRGSGLHNCSLPPTPSPKSARSRCPFQQETVRTQLSAVSSSPGCPRLKKKQPLRLGGFQTGETLQKVLSLSQDDSAFFPGVKLQSCTSPRVLLPRSSSRVSLQDEYDDSEFACPFAVEDDDIRTEPPYQKGHVHENSECGGSVRKSQNAAVGELVQMLKRAPPLCQDSSYAIKMSQFSAGENWNEGIQSNKNTEPGPGGLQNAGINSCISASGLSKSRTTADAFDELRSYREMKDLLLRQVETKSSATHAGESAGDSSSKFR